jgi:DNA recombination protein RmuC
MQTLASGVGDLKRVLTNVKTRGTFGEVQVGTLLEQILTPDQYDKNVSTTGTQERVEFAIKMPGREAGKTCWLPVDAKFPMEDYQRLVEASERGDAEAVDAASRSLETTLKQCARTISQKYLLPPETTDFGILFLATEGLYAEALRRPGLAETLQREFRVVVTGPNTFAAILNSLQMGFRTLAIQRRTSEVWETLGAVKTQFSKYADVLAKVKKQLHMASNTVETAEQRTRVLQRQLRDVEIGTSPDVELEEPLLPLDESQLSFTNEGEQSGESWP